MGFGSLIEGMVFNPAPTVRNRYIVFHKIGLAVKVPQETIIEVPVEKVIERVVTVPQELKSSRS